LLLEHNQSQNVNVQRSAWSNIIRLSKMRLTFQSGCIFAKVLQLMTLSLLPRLLLHLPSYLY